jgi:hypothetical protein
MGVSPDNLDMIGSLYRRGSLPRGGAVADLGCSQLRNASPDDVRRFFGYFGTNVPDQEIERLAAHNVFLTEHLKRAGLSYRAFDIVTAPDCEWLDLNSDRVPKRWRGHFDLVLNFGTTEHVLNQLNALRILHDLAKAQGLIYSYFVRGGYMDHGLLHYSDRFVDLLCAANGYETIWRSDQTDPGTQCTWIVLRKSGAAPFVPPIDVEIADDRPPLAAPPKKPLLARLFG